MYPQSRCRTRRLVQRERGSPLTSLNGRRAYSPQNFGSLVQNDFCNTIGTCQTRRAWIFPPVPVLLIASTVAFLANSDARAHTAPHKHRFQHHPVTKMVHRKRDSIEARRPNAPAIPPPIARPALADLPPAFAAVKQAAELIGRGKVVEATVIEKSIVDPTAQKLLEWALLRRGGSELGFQRYDAFIRANPVWPSIPLLRRRAEAALWRERADAATVRSFLGGQPASPIGKLVLARELMGQGDRVAAEREVRSVWRSERLSAELEGEVLSGFPDALTRGDHQTRMDRRIGAKDFGAAMRAAKRIGNDQVAIVKACIAAEAKSANGGKLLDAVPTEARNDLGYALCRIHWLMRNDSPGSNIHGRVVTPKEDIAAAVKLALAASQEDLRQQDTDEWWRERRALARKLLDRGEAKAAYQVTGSALPANPYYRAEFHFMAGWIALRYLSDPQTASKHFARIDEGATDPHILARAAYWRGRAAEAAGNITEMHAEYEAAGRYPTAYYGQLARVRLRLGSIALRAPPQMADTARSEVLHAASILYAIGAHDLVLNFVSDVADESNDTATITELGELTTKYHDARRHDPKSLGQKNHCDL